MLQLLHKFYPERTVTVSSRDPDFITPVIKAKLRRKNKLMRAGRTEEAGALAHLIGKEIMQNNRTKLSKVGNRAEVNDIWAAVRRLTGNESLLKH